MLSEMKGDSGIGNTPAKGTEGADTGLIDGRPAPPAASGRRPSAPGTTMGKECSSSRIWMILAITFMAISIALSIYLVYDKELKDESKGSASISANESEILDMYPSYFRTVQEQRVVERSFEKAKTKQNKTMAPMDDKYPPRFCSYQCFNNSKILEISRKRRAPRKLIARRSTLKHQHWTVKSVLHKLVKRQTTPDVFHGCCISQSQFISPSTAQTANGQQVTIVHFASRRQYFPSEQCSQAQGCNGCQCAQQTTFFSAVVRFDDQNGVRLEFIMIPGCCKCYNNL